MFGLKTFVIQTLREKTFGIQIFVAMTFGVQMLRVRTFGIQMLGLMSFEIHVASEDIRNSNVWSGQVRSGVPCLLPVNHVTQYNLRHRLSCRGPNR